MTPNPIHHAFYADKRNLITLSQANTVLREAIPDRHLRALQRLPSTRALTQESADELWQTRKQHFFKPAAGYGSRAAYRGSKITKKVWQHMLANDYIAQRFVAPRYAPCNTMQVARSSNLMYVSTPTMRNPCYTQHAFTRGKPLTCVPKGAG